MNILVGRGQAPGGPTVNPGDRRRFGLGTALAALVLSSVALTALLIHLTWSYAARRDVADIVRQLNTQVATNVRQKVQAAVTDASSLQNTVQAILAKGTLTPHGSADLETLLVPLLRSRTEVSWIALGFPDGNFFGTQKIDENELDLVEIDRRAPDGLAMMKISRYDAASADMVALGGVEQKTDYDVRREEWFTRAMSEGNRDWTRLPHLPHSERNAISISMPLVVEGRVDAVLSVALEVDRLSSYLAGVEVGGGTVTVIDPTGYVVASPDEATIRQQRGHETPGLDELAARLPTVGLITGMLDAGTIRIEGLTELHQQRVTDPADGRDYFVTLTPMGFQGWVLATVIPADHFLAGIDQNAKFLIPALIMLTIMIAAGAAIAAQRLVGRPLLRIAEQLLHIEQFELERIRYRPSPLREVDDFSAALVQMSAGLNSFRKYIPADLVRTLVANGIEAMPGGAQRPLTVLFTDIVGFTSLSEERGEAIVPLLTEYLEINTGAVLAAGGTIDKFIGDAVMAFWGAPLPNERHALSACIAALDAQRRLAASGTGLRMRVGINTGTMLVGNVGSRERLSYTVIGDAVNVASRLESACKYYGVEIMIGEDTRGAAGDGILVRRLDRIAVYGRLGGTTIYELLDLAGGTLPDWVAPYEAGLDDYAARRWESAIARFTTVITLRGEDRAAGLLIARCRELLRAPPPDDWLPLASLDGK